MDRVTLVCCRVFCMQDSMVPISPSEFNTLNDAFHVTLMRTAISKDANILSPTYVCSCNLVRDFLRVPWRETDHSPASTTTSLKTRTNIRSVEGTLTWTSVGTFNGPAEKGGGA